MQVGVDPDINFQVNLDVKQCESLVTDKTLYLEKEQLEDLGIENPLVVKFEHAKETVISLQGDRTGEGYCRGEYIELYGQEFSGYVSELHLKAEARAAVGIYNFDSKTFTFQDKYFKVKDLNERGYGNSKLGIFVINDIVQLQCPYQFSKILVKKILYDGDTQEYLLKTDFNQSLVLKAAEENHTFCGHEFMTIRDTSKLYLCVNCPDKFISKQIEKGNENYLLNLKVKMTTLYSRLGRTFDTNLEKITESFCLIENFLYQFNPRFYLLAKYGSFYGYKLLDFADYRLVINCTKKIITVDKSRGCREHLPITEGGEKLYLDENIQIKRDSKEIPCNRTVSYKALDLDGNLVLFSGGPEYRQVDLTNQSEIDFLMRFEYIRDQDRLGSILTNNETGQVDQIYEESNNARKLNLENSRKVKNMVDKSRHVNMPTYVKLFGLEGLYRGVMSIGRAIYDNSIMLYLVINYTIFVAVTLVGHIMTRKLQMTGIFALIIEIIFPALLLGKIILRERNTSDCAANNCAKSQIVAVMETAGDIRRSAAKARQSDMSDSLV